MADNKEETSVSEVEFENIDFLVDSSSVMTPGDAEAKKGIFSQPQEFIEMPGEAPVEDKVEDSPPADPSPTGGEEDVTGGDTIEQPGENPPQPNAEEIEEAFAIDNPPTEDDPSKNKGGRPTALVTAAKALIDKKLIFPFDDGKKVEDYTAEDFTELFEANLEKKEDDMYQEIQNQFFQSLPPKMQQAYQYIANGGQDLTGLFSHLAKSQETLELDASTKEGQEDIVRRYYNAIQYGDAQAIQKEINGLKDRGELQEKAEFFKPKLDQMEESRVQQQLRYQEEQNKKKQQQMQGYMGSVYNVLEKGTLNGIKLDSNTQNLLYDGLVNPQYPSISGKSTNLLGHLLERKQWVEPDHELVAEVLYLLADPDGYRKSVRDMSEKEVVEKTVRTLKTEQSASKGGGSSAPEEAEDATINKNTVSRKKRGFFNR